MVVFVLSHSVWCPFFPFFSPSSLSFLTPPPASSSSSFPLNSILISSRSGVSGPFPSLFPHRCPSSRPYPSSSIPHQQEEQHHTILIPLSILLASYQ